jgi:hypothetical protein
MKIKKRLKSFEPTLNMAHDLVDSVVDFRSPTAISPLSSFLHPPPASPLVTLLSATHVKQG